jgi:hypothetical protein
MRRIPSLALLLLASSCVAPAGRTGGPVTDSVQYTVRRTQGTKDQPSVFMVEAKLYSKGKVVQEPSVAIYDQEWAMVKVGELLPSINDIQVSPDKEEALPSEIQIFSGTLIGFRCRDGSAGRIDVRMRIYEVRDGKLAVKISSNDLLVSGESKTVTVPPSK